MRTNHDLDHDPNILPAGLPIPEDDGAASHLAGMRLPMVTLQATDGARVDLARVPGRTVVDIYPRTGRPGVALPDGWDAIPGARGCTPQSCSFRDHFAELKTLGVAHLFGLSTQDTDYQREAVDRLHLPFAILSDADLQLTHALGLHTAGLNHVLRENPAVTIYTPLEGAGFGSPLPSGLTTLIKRQVAAVPDDLRYYGGNPPDENRADPPWEGAHFVQITAPREVLPGFFLIATQSDKPGTREMNEISLLVRTAMGGVVVVGCSHPGIEKILDAVIKIEPRIYSVLGGFHLVDASDAEVTEMIMRLRDKWRIERMAAGHCTGQFAFAEMVRIYGASFDHAGVGAVIALPA